MKTFIRVRKDFNLVNDLSIDFSIPITNDVVVFPPSLGAGFLKGFSFPSDLNLYIGRYKLNTSWELETINEPDTGAFCIFTSIISNQIKIKTDGEWVTIDKDSPRGMLFYSPGTSVEVRYPIKETFKTVAVTFTRETVSAIIDNPEILKGVNPASPFIYFDETVPEAENLIQKLATLCDDNRSSRFETYMALLNFLRLTLDRMFINKERYNLSGLLKEDIEKIFLIKSILMEDTQSIPKISALAAEVGVSESKMIKLFKQVFDSTIYQFAQHTKIIHAKNLLSSRKYNVSEVGYMVGYTNMTHFGKAFKKYHKVNPSEYLRSILNTNEN